MVNINENQLLNDVITYVAKTIEGEIFGLLDDIREVKEDLTSEIDKRIEKIGNANDPRIKEYDSLKIRMTAKFQEISDEIVAKYGTLEESTKEKLEKLDANSQDYEQNIETLADELDNNCDLLNENYFNMTSEIVANIEAKIENIYERKAEKNTGNSNMNRTPNLKSALAPSQN